MLRLNYVVYSLTVLQIFLGVMIGSVALSQAFPFVEIFANGKVAASKIYRIIDEKPKIDSSSDKGEKLTNIRGRLELRNVCFTYPARPEVQVSFISFDKNFRFFFV